MPQQKSWLARTTNAATAGIGNFAGGIVQAAGNGVAGAGKGAGARYASPHPFLLHHSLFHFIPIHPSPSPPHNSFPSPLPFVPFVLYYFCLYRHLTPRSVTNTTRTWGDAVRNYGNYIKDVSGAQGSRAPTGQNPLGLSSTPTGAKASGVKKKITAGPTGGYKASTGTNRQSASNPLGL